MTSVYYIGGGDARYIGDVTQTAYIFKEGYPTPVDDRDLNTLLDKKKASGCCGTPQILHNLFEIAQEH